MLEDAAAPLEAPREPRRRLREWRLVRLGLLRSRRTLRDLKQRLTAEERRSIEEEVHRAARASPGYLVLLFCSCGIAALGLLQSSPAVVIGAMLISPLMGPILSMGLALARVELAEFRRAALSLAVGSAVALMASAMIVWASPLKAVTPEILARTRPTLLDLLVALLSGWVAAYVIFSRKGGVIAGVAIATALMPPLAVTGYGLATGSGPVAGGAFLLFITNVVAILGAVFLVARLYHFRPVYRRGRWHAAALAVAMAALAAPLALSLREIALETQSTLHARSAVEAVFRPTRGWIEDLSVTVEDARLTGVDAVVVTHGFVPTAPDEIRRRLGAEVAVNVEQIVTGDAAATRSSDGGSALTNRALADGRSFEATPERRLRAMLQPLMTVAGVSHEGERLEVFAGGAPLPLARYRSIEAAAQVFAPGYTVNIIPPPAPLPPVRFQSGRADLDEEARLRIELIAWALSRWRVEEVTVTGEASAAAAGPSSGDERLARRRAEAVAAALESIGLSPRPIARVTPPSDDASAAWRAVVEPVAPGSKRPEP